MIASSDYSFLDRWLHVVASVGFIGFYLYSYNQLPSLRTASLPWHQDRKCLSFLATLAALSLLFVYDIVAVVVKYSEGFLGLPLGAATPTSWITKPVDMYSQHSKDLVSFSDFLINLFWSARMAALLYFSMSFFYRGSPHSHKLNIAVLTHTIGFLILQIILTSLDHMTWEIPQWIYSIEFFFLSVWFLIKYITLRRSWAKEESAAGSYTPFEIQCGGWISLLVAIEVVSFTALSIGLADRESSSEYLEYLFESKATMDFFLFSWNLALNFSFIGSVIHMFHDSEVFSVGEATVASMKGTNSMIPLQSVPGRAQKRDTSSAHRVD